MASEGSPSSSVACVPANYPAAKEWMKIIQNTGYWDKDFHLFGEEKLFFPKTYARWADEIKNLEVREDDAWVVTFPRCGTTWSIEMVWLIVNNCNFEQALAEDLQKRAPFVELDALFRAPTKWGSSETPYTTMDEVRDMTSPRVIKTHLTRSLLPDDIYKRGKTVYVARNPKDACVSFFHQTALINGYEGDLDEFAYFFMNNAVSYAPYWEHVRKFWDLRDHPNVLFLTYEEMKADLRFVLMRVAKFFGKELSEEQLEKLLDHLSFASMKKNPMTNREIIVQEMQKVHGKAAKTEFIRKGQVGSWKEEMSQETIDKFDEWIKENQIAGLYDA